MKLWAPRWRRRQPSGWEDTSPEGWLYELIPIGNRKGWRIVRDGVLLREVVQAETAKFGVRMDWEARNKIVSYPRVLGGGKKAERVTDGASDGT